jgi:hypothetical protein
VQGDFNSLVFDGPAASSAQVLRLSSSPNSLAQFKATNNLTYTPFANLLAVDLVVAKAWPAGEMRTYYL